jgi:hypothetical protein
MANKFLNTANLGNSSNALEALELVAENDANGNPLYIGQAKPGSATSAAVWRIKAFTYDGNEAVLTIKFANSSRNFAFVWDDRADYF